jgi:hypothetical protein
MSLFFPSSICSDLKALSFHFIGLSLSRRSHPHVFSRSAYPGIRAGNSIYWSSFSLHLLPSPKQLGIRDREQQSESGPGSESESESEPSESELEAGFRYRAFSLSLFTSFRVNGCLFCCRFADFFSCIRSGRIPTCRSRYVG